MNLHKLNVSLSGESTVCRGIKYVLQTLTLKAANKNCSRRYFNYLLLSFEENNYLIFHVNPSRGFYWNIKSYFLWKTMKKYLWMSSAAVVIGALRVKVYGLHLCFSAIFSCPVGMYRELNTVTLMLAWASNFQVLPQFFYVIGKALSD